jgi:chromosome segregation ATPase
LNAEDPSGSDVISQIEFTPESGEIKTIRADISGITLNGYASTADNADIASTDTLGLALGKLQTQIIEEETARANAINDLNTSIATQFKTFEDEDNAIKDLINSTIEEFEDKFEEIGSNSSSTTERIDGEIGAIDSRIATLETNAPTWTAAAEKHADYDNTFRILNQNYENLERDVRSLEGDARTLEGDVRSLEGELSEANTLISSYEGQIASL